MSNVILFPSSTAHWFALVNDAELASSLELGEELESYLVFLLMRFTQKPDFVTNIIALEFLESLHLSGQQRWAQLREVGDKCLLIAGLFPEVIKRRRVNENYFVDLGQSAYGILSTGHGQDVDLYNHLSQQFEQLIHVLAKIRKAKLDDMSPKMNSYYSQFLTRVSLN